MGLEVEGVERGEHPWADWAGSGGGNLSYDSYDWAYNGRNKLGGLNQP